MTLKNELLAGSSDPFDSGFGDYVPGPGETTNPDGMYGGDLNWEDSFDVAAKHLGVSESQWKAFIEGVNTVKANMRQWEEGGGNAARVMQDRTIPNAMRDRLIMRFMNEGMTEDEAFAAAMEHPEIAAVTKNIDYYNEMNDALNSLYASVGLDPSGAIDAGTGTSHGNGYTVDFNFLTGEVTHNKGDAVHDFGKGLIKGIAAAAFGAGLTSYLGTLGLSKGTASAISKVVTNMVTGSGGELTVEDALGLALGPGGEFADVDISGEIKDAVVDYVTNPDNYGDDNVIVWETHGGTDGSDGIIVNIPNYDDWMTQDDGGGGGEDPSSSTDSSSSSSSSSTDSTDPSDPNNSTSTTNPDWVYDEATGTWNNPETGEIIYGPNNSTGTMSHEEMQDAWESGEYSWEPSDPNVGGSDFDDNPVGWVWDATNEVWNPVFRDTELGPDDIVAPTSTKPTKPPVTDTGTSTSGSSTVTGNTPDGWTPDNSNISDGGGDDGTSDTSGTGVGTVTGNTPDGWNPDNGNISDGGGDDGGTKGDRGDGPDGDGDDGDGDDGTGQGPDGDGWDDGRDGDGPGPQPTAGGLFNPEWSPLDWSRAPFEMAKPATLTPYESIINSLKRDKGMLS